MDIGANDCWVVPIQMKKGRSAVQFCVLCSDDVLQEIQKTIFENSPTIGLRVIPVHRFHLPRKSMLVQTSVGLVRVKCSLVASSSAGQESIDSTGKGQGKGVWKFKAEFEDCQKIALATDRSLSQIAEEAEQIAAKQILTEDNLAVETKSDRNSQS